MARETIFRCDICGSDKDVLTWKISNGKTIEIDLCEKHSKALADLQPKGRELAAPQSGRRDPNKTYDPLVREV